MAVRSVRYGPASGFVAETRLVNGVYVMERRMAYDRRRAGLRYRGYDRRLSLDRRDKAAKVDVYV